MEAGLGGRTKWHCHSMGDEAISYSAGRLTSVWVFETSVPIGKGAPMFE